MSADIVLEGFTGGGGASEVEGDWRDLRGKSGNNVIKTYILIYIYIYKGIPIYTKPGNSGDGRMGDRVDDGGDNLSRTPKYKNVWLANTCSI